jgi:hypothetical protein
MQPLPSEPISTRPDVVHAKHIYGLWFGITLGFLFSVFTWGIDAYRLQQMHAFAPWLKFLTGMVPCVVAGGLTGWLAAKLDRPILALVLWAVAGLLFAWLAVNLPLQIIPRLLNIIEPDTQGLLHYTYYQEFSARLGIAYFWLAIFISLAGLMQIPLSDSAVFATSFFGRISPMLVVMILMMIAGTTMDNLNNEKLRSPVDTVDSAVQFSLDHQGQKIDPAVYRQRHLASLRTVQDVIGPERKFVVSGYDSLLEQVQVLGRFGNVWVECEIFYNQLLSCEQVQAR